MKSTRKGFTPLHLHSDFSTLDGAAKLDDIISRAKEVGMEAIALTDHGTMAGTRAFYLKAKEAGIKPILGSEVYVAPTSRHIKEVIDGERRAHHLVLLVKNQKGFENLSKLTNIAAKEGFYFRPRIDDEVLAEHSEGLVCLSACLGGAIPTYLLEGRYEDAKAKALKYKEIFKDDFYLEVQGHDIEGQAEANEMIYQLAEEIGVEVVATNDSHFARKEDYKIHEVVYKVGTNQKIDDKNYFNFYKETHYIMSYDEMLAMFPEREDVVNRTMEIADKCNFEFEEDATHLPEFDYQAVGAKDSKEVLIRLLNEGLREYEKKDGPVTQEVLDRLKMEVGVIESMGYIDYFLIVHDIIRYADEVGIAVGPGRGSAAGSLVSYLLGIVKVNPIEYGLLFERFLNPERVSMPDIDLDFEPGRTEEIAEYLQAKYGDDYFAKIQTNSKFKIKQTLQDVARVYDVGVYEDFKHYNMVKLTKAIPDADATVEEALEASEELREFRERSEAHREIVDITAKIVGNVRHHGVHPAGMIISRDELSKTAPMTVTDKDGLVTNLAEYDKDEVEELGLYKFDILKLDTVEVISEIEKELRDIHGIDIDADEIPMGDEATMKNFALGKTQSVFQFESPGMIGVLRSMHADKFEDIYAANALYRPGPMDLIPQFIENRRNPENIEYIHPMLEPILEETYGIIVYQEQLLEILQKVGGYTLGRADIVRRLISDKDGARFEAEKESFVEGAVVNGLTQAQAEKLFLQMSDFANYAFNKSHAVAYSLLAYQTMYLKTHYPAVFLAKSLDNKASNYEKLIENVTFYQEEYGVEVLSPDINRSRYGFSYIINDGDISSNDFYLVYALKGIKGLSERLAHVTVEERDLNGDYKNVEDYVRRVSRYPGVSVGESALRKLISLGMFRNTEDSDIAQALAKVKSINSENRKSINRARAKRIGILLIEDVRTPAIKEVVEDLNAKSYATSASVYNFLKRELSKKEIDEEHIDRVLARAQEIYRDHTDDLRDKEFDEFFEYEVEMEEVVPFTSVDLAQAEIEHLGLIKTFDLDNDYSQAIRAFNITDRLEVVAGALENKNSLYKEGQRVSVPGIIQDISVFQSRSGQMANITLTDGKVTLPAVIFAKTYKALDKDLLKVGQAVLITGSIGKEYRGTRKVSTFEIVPLVANGGDLSLMNQEVKESKPKEKTIKYQRENAEKKKDVLYLMDINSLEDIKDKEAAFRDMPAGNAMVWIRAEGKTFRVHGIHWDERLKEDLVEEELSKAGVKAKVKRREREV